MADNLLANVFDFQAPEWAVTKCPFEVAVEPSTVSYLVSERRRWLNSEQAQGEYFFACTSVKENMGYSYFFSDPDTAFMFKIALS